MMVWIWHGAGQIYLPRITRIDTDKGKAGRLKNLRAEPSFQSFSYSALQSFRMAGQRHSDFEHGGRREHEGFLTMNGL
jgi:hypothetical protein